MTFESTLYDIEGLRSRHPEFQIYGRIEKEGPPYPLRPRSEWKVDVHVGVDATYRASLFKDAQAACDALRELTGNKNLVKMIAMGLVHGMRQSCACTERRDRPTQLSIKLCFMSFSPSKATDEHEAGKEIHELLCTVERTLREHFAHKTGEK